MEPFTLFHKVQRLRLLKFTWREPSKGENEKSKFPRKEPPGDMDNFHHSLVEAEGGLSAVASRGIGQVAMFATKQLIDIFLLEHLIGKMSLSGPRFFEKEHSSMVLDSLLFDVLLRKFFSIQQWQRATFENVPLRDFHLKAFTEVALDVILTELNKLAAEDMEDLLEYERGVQSREQEQMCYQKLQKAE